MRQQRRPAQCHPERRHAAKGLCLPCYIERYPKAKRADCHGDRLGYIDGLCRVCYDRRLKEHNPEYAERQRANYGRWSTDNRDRKREYDAAYHATDEALDRKALRARHATLAAFGLTWADELAMLDAQGWGCGVCGGPPTRRWFDIDHDHDTGEVRGLICGTCNKGLGLLGDDAAGVERALAYLRCPPAAQVRAVARRTRGGYDLG